MKRFIFSCIAGLLFLGGWMQSASAQGFLIPTDRKLPALGLKHHRVHVQIQDRAARTTVTQVFVNPTSRLLEATYIFPLPKGATISNFALYINGKKTKGQVLVRSRARAIYQSIVRRMQDPGLIEHMGGQLFKARVFPIPRRGEQKIEIAFSQVIPYRSGVHRYVYPLKTARQSLQTLRDFTMSVDLKSRTPIKNIYSHTHKVSIARRGDKRAIIGFEKNQARLNRDFVMYYSVSPKALGLNVLSHKEKGKDGYFLMMATPKVSYGSKELVGKNITFVLDTSGSMATNQRMKWAKSALMACIRKLNPRDHFNIIRFSTDVEELYSGLQSATAHNTQKALKFVQRMEAAGGTAIDEAIQKALKQKPKGSGVNIIILITDGHPTIGETSPSSILKNVQKSNQNRARIFTFGIGSNINIKLLDQMAQKTGGTGDYVKPGKGIQEQISWFYDKVRYPVLSAIQMKLGKGVRLVDVYPKKIPDLFRGGQIVLLGRYRGAGHIAVGLQGQINGRKKSYVFETSFPKSSKAHDFIPRIWAHRKIAYLLDNIRLHGERHELKQEVIRLAKKFSIVTPYTSYLVVEDKDRWRLRPRSKTGAEPLIQRPVRGFGKGRLMRRHSGMRNQEQSLGGATRQRPSSSAPPAPPAQIRSYKSLKDTSGRRAVETAKKLRKMKSSSVSKTQSNKRAKYIKGRVFRYASGTWVDSKWRTSMKRIYVRYLSRLYFQILEKRPDLRPYFALGRHVTIVVNKKYAIVVGRTESKKWKAYALDKALKKDK